MKMHVVEFECNECSLKSSAYRSINRDIPKFCSDSCRLKNARKKYRKFVWQKASQEERQKHLIEYFEKNVIRKNGCWDWKNNLSDRYPRIYFSKTEKRISAHIFSWKLHFGDIPSGMNVCHKCDNTRCTNPSHLFLGSSADNIKDKVNKNRQAYGESHGNVKLNDLKVKEIKKLLTMGITMTRIAKDFGVNISTIERIKNKKTWKHIN